MTGLTVDEFTLWLKGWQYGKVRMGQEQPSPAFTGGGWRQRLNHSYHRLFRVPFNLRHEGASPCGPTGACSKSTAQTRQTCEVILGQWSEPIQLS